MTNVQGAVAEVQNDVSTVQGVVTDHKRMIDAGKDVLEQGQVQIITLENRVMATHSDMVKVRGDVSDVQGIISVIRRDVGGQAGSLSVARSMIDQSQAEIERMQDENRFNSNRFSQVDKNLLLNQDKIKVLTSIQIK